MQNKTLPFIDLGAQFRAYEAELRAAVADVLESGRYILGPEVDAFERELAEWIGVAYCVSCASGTDALVLALRACGVGPGDEVITTPFTFFATAEAITLVGADPVFADILPDTFTIDPKRIRELVTDKTRAIIPVSIFGQPADMDEIDEIAGERGITVIEDAAQSVGGTYRGRRSGSLSPLAATSFYPTKPLGGYGDGGAVFTTDEAIASELRLIRNHGQSANYVHVRIGVNSRLDALQAAVLRVKLRRLEDEITARQRIASRYDSLLASVPGCTTPFVAAERTSAWAQYSVLVDDRDGMIAHLKDGGVPAAVHYPKPVYRQEPYANASGSSACPVTEDVCSRIMSLPMHAFLEEETQDRIVERMSVARIRSGV